MASQEGFRHGALRRLMGGRRVDDLGRRAVVFAPHPDDETLGCGGTIALKARQGAEVRVVYFTDGSGSHPHLMPPEEMGRLRRTEALAACQVLGVEGDRVRFLGLEDGHVQDEVDLAKDLVLEVLREYRPEEVFVTHGREPPADHSAANLAVREALGQVGPVVVWEYPIWMWDGWPWVPFPQGSWRHPWAMAKRLGRSGPSLALITDCNCSTDIRQTLEVKRRAMSQHRTQTTRYDGSAGWEAIGDIHGGRMMGLFFQPFEAFRRYRTRGRARP